MYHIDPICREYNTVNNIPRDFDLDDNNRLVNVIDEFTYIPEDSGIRLKGLTYLIEFTHLEKDFEIELDIYYTNNCRYKSVNKKILLITTDLDLFIRSSVKEFISHRASENNSLTVDYLLRNSLDFYRAELYLYSDTNEINVKQYKYNVFVKDQQILRYI